MPQRDLVIITGSSGFIGSALVEKLAGRYAPRDAAAALQTTRRTLIGIGSVPAIRAILSEQAREQEDYCDEESY